MLTSFWECLKYSRLHCYLYLFLKFPCILFLFQAESVKAIRRDGKWRDLSGVVKKPERSGLESEKTSGVWVRLFTLPFCRSAATILPFVYFPPFYWLNIWNRGKGNLCIPSEAFLWKLDSLCMTKQEVYTSTTIYLNPGGNTMSQTNFFPYFKFSQLGILVNESQSCPPAIYSKIKRAQLWMKFQH